jgi:site-specific DNA recombinase
MPRLWHDYLMSATQIAGKIGWVRYCRLSKGRAGIARQRAITDAHIRKVGGAIIDGADFSDADQTAYQQVGAAAPKRDDFSAMLAFLRSHPGVRLIAWHADRLARNTEDAERLISVCADGGILVETPSGGVYDLATANGRRRFREDIVNAAYEVDHSRERVLAAKTESREAGMWLGGPRPFGWRPDPREPGGLALEDAEHEAIKTAARDVIAGSTCSAVARIWDAAGLKTTRGRTWQAAGVRLVLTRESNCAPPPALWAPHMTADTWRVLCRVLAPRTAALGRPAEYLASGIARCGLCWQPLYTGRGRDGRPVYRCVSLTRANRPATGHVTRRQDYLDEYIAEAAREWFRKSEARQLLLLSSASELPRLEADAAAVEAAMSASNDLRRRGLLTLGEFAEERGEHRRQLADLGARISAARMADVLSPMVRDPDGTWESANLGQRRRIISELATWIIIPQRPGRGFDPDSVVILWKKGL